MLRLAASGSASTSWPQTAMLPEVGDRKPQSIFMVVDLPAPFGPRKPSTSPLATDKLMLSTAGNGLNCLTRFFMSIVVLRGPLLRRYPLISARRPSDQSFCPKGSSLADLLAFNRVPGT